ncbi:hypothetical protein FSP39_020726 [Pinctada imbricata]|uniref:DRBM domain-containing protein n=1 Tax=Pinctada imbricata TaxID=66713 RepID=A0AA88XQI0_PINIB|nr:hypothetical protein FSP39_020726 [Pinctada imbricata]
MHRMQHLTYIFRSSDLVKKFGVAQYPISTDATVTKLAQQNRNVTSYSSSGMGVQQQYQPQMAHPQVQVTNQHMTMGTHSQQNRQKGNMMGVGIIKNSTPNSLPNNQMMPSSNSYPSTQHSVAGMHQMNHTNAVSQSSVPISSQNGSVSVSVATSKQHIVVTPNDGQQQTNTQSATQQNATTEQTQPNATGTIISDQLSTEQEDSNGSEASQGLANTKEKTPMCLINELARYNKIMHQYTLVDEQGPAHKKVFYVQLKLGDSEEYSANGPSIKKAQHAAASQALQKTSYTAPPPKPPKAQTNFNTETMGDGQPVTPTVKLNALAMKRGEQTYYKPIETRTPQQYYPPPNYNYRGMFNQRYHYPRMPRVFYVSLKVGAREFVGEGPTRQEARHDAAKKALGILEKLPVPNEEERKIECPVDLPTDAEKDNLKSEISLVHEIALKRNLSVGFEVTRESGPPHMKTFVTCCKVGDYLTESEGNSKKVSKKKAAEMMLEKLKELPPLPPSVSRLRNKPIVKKKNKNLIKQQVQKADPNYGVGINPISRLIQIQQAQQKKEPVYTLVTERGLPRRREFVIQVQVDDQACTGVGPNKKLAKRHAAEAMLTLLGYNKPSPQPTKPAIKTASTPEGSSEKKVTFQESTDESGDQSADGKAGRQLMPGLLLLPDSKYTGGPIYGQGQNHVGDYTAFANVSKRPEITLRELASANGLEIKFDEFQSQTNSQQSEYLSRVTLLFTPPRVFHGSGGNAEAARDLAALEALKFLHEMGKGDGPHVKQEQDLANSGQMGVTHAGRVTTM